MLGRTIVLVCAGQATSSNLREKKNLVSNGNTDFTPMKCFNVV